MHYNFIGRRWKRYNVNRADFISSFRLMAVHVCKRVCVRVWCICPHFMIIVYWFSVEKKSIYHSIAVFGWYYCGIVDYMNVCNWLKMASAWQISFLVRFLFCFSSTCRVLCNEDDGDGKQVEVSCQNGKLLCELTAFQNMITEIMNVLIQLTLLNIDPWLAI